MEAAPLPVLKKFLDRVEQELIPKHLFEQAENILLKLLSSNVRHRLPQLSDQAIFLLQKCKDARFQSHAGITELAEGDTRFSTLPNHGQVEECKRVSARIKKQGCVFNLGV